MTTKSKKHPRVLIVSHNAMSDTQSNGKTLSVFFKHWDTECLAQVYLTTDVPDFSVCHKYFQINDFDIVRRFFLNKKKQGRIVEKTSVAEMKSLKDEVTKSPTLKLLRRNISPFFRLLRDLMWSFSGYKTRELTKFIEEFNPQIIFFQSSSGVFAYSLTKWVCKSKNIPLIMQVTDDYVSGMFTLDPFFWIQMLRVRLAFKWAISYSSCVVAIGEKMVKEYKTRFGGNYTIAMNSASEISLPKYTADNQVINFVYAGNLGLNRWKILVLLASCLEELKNDEGICAYLSIYSLIEPDAEELKFLNKSTCSEFKGSLTTEQLNDVKTHSDVLVHVEAFDKTNKNITRLSISTKIPEYLASGRCIFAVGPEDVASMQYIVEDQLGVAVLSDRKEELKEALKDIIMDKEKRISYSEKGIGVARLRHNSQKTAESISQMIKSTIACN